ncbi:MAG: hypothetical protein WBM28_10335 [Burkholderiales bacterium]
MTHAISHPERTCRSPPAVAFGHVGIFATDARKTEDFHSRFLGFTVADRGPALLPVLVFSRRPQITGNWGT